MKHIITSLLIILPLLIFSHNDGIEFVKNKGQWPEQVKFKSTVAGGNIWLENNKISYQFTRYPKIHGNFNTTEKPIVQQHVVWAKFDGANENFEIIQQEKSDHYYNYFLGNDQSKWASNVYAYSDIKYQNLYKKVDLRIYNSDGNMKYDFIIKPGGKNNIKINYEGHDNIKINENGELLIFTSLGQLIEEKPYAYQIKNGVKEEVKCKFTLKDNIVSFSLGNYDKKIDLIIDPVLIFASYNGSPSDNFGMTATYDDDGSLYTGGIVYGANYPTTPGVYDPVGSFPGTVASSATAPVYGITDVFITKFAPDGTSLIYSTYIGGGDQNGGTEAVHSLICDSLGNLHMYGTTSSTDFPVTPSAYQNTNSGGIRQLFQFNGIDYIATGGIGNGGGSDIFITKFNAAGSALLGSTFIGGTGNDGLNYQLSGGSYNSVNAYDSLTNNYGDQFRGEIMLDDSGYVYITSSTYSTDFPIVNGFQSSNNGMQDAIACKFSPNLDNLMWSTYIGGTEKDAGYSIKVNNNYEVYVTGGTCSNDFSTTLGTIDTAYQGGKVDGYITKISQNGSTILASTFIGTNAYDQCYFVEIDRFGTIYIVGQTEGNFPVINAAYSNPNSGTFIMRIDSNLSTIDYSTIFGNGNINTEFSPSAFLVDRCENVYVSGWGGNILGPQQMLNMPTTANAFQPTSPNGYDFYLFVLERNAQSQLYGTYFGGGTSNEHVDGGTSRFDKNGIVYQSVCAGCGNGYDDFPTTTGAWSNLNQSANCNNGVFKFDFEIIPKAEFTVDEFEGCAPLTVTFTNSSSASDTYLWDFGGGDTTSQILNPVKTYNTPGVYNVTLLITDSICNTVDTAFQTITVGQPVTVGGGNIITTCDTATLSINTTGNPGTFYWSSNNQFTDTLNPNPTDSSLFVTVTDTSWFYVFAGDSLCNDIDSFRVDYVGFTINASDTGVCNGDPATILTSHNSGLPLTYSWTPTNTIVSGATSPNPTVAPSVTTTYTVTATSTNGCIATDTAQVVVSGFDPNNISIWADEDTLYGGGTYLHVSPSTGFSYLWFPPTNLSDPTSPNPYVTPNVPSVTTYTVILTENQSGCGPYSRTITIYALELNCGEPDVFIPNAFTPNQDNENDILYVRGKNVEEMVLKIYNRWGELVFETDDQKIGWDGTYNGDLVDPAVFVYHLTIKCIDGQEYFKKGNITVIR